MNGAPFSPREEKMLAAGREQIAYHEAGHVAVALFLRLRFHSVTIKPEVSADGLYIRKGHVQPHNTGRRPNYGSAAHDRQLERTIIFSLAGLEAERIFTGKRVRHGDDEAADLQAARKFANLKLVQADEQERQAYFTWARLRACGILRLVWPKVQAMAAELLTKETITYKDANRIYCQTIRKGDDHERKER